MVREQQILSGYEEIEKELRSCHFYPDRQTKDATITALHVTAFPERMDSIVERLTEILENEKVSIKKFPNQNYIEIKLKKEK